MHSFLSGIFTRMNGDREKCSCEKSELVESDSSNSESAHSKEKRSKISLFGLRRARPLHFASKRSKKTPMSAGTSGSSIKKSPKWGIKFNCTKREPKVAFNEENQNCCRCTCYRRTNESSGSNEAVPAEDDGKTPAEASVSGSSNVDVEYNDNRPQVAALEQIPTVEIEQIDGIRGIYSTAPVANAISNIIISAPFLDMQW